MDKLYILTGPLQGAIVELIGEEITVGRSPDNAICLDDESVSTHHATLIRHGRDWVVRDVGSAAGTFVANEKIVTATLEDGNKIAFGSVKLLFETSEKKLRLPSSARISSQEASPETMWPFPNISRARRTTLTSGMSTLIQVCGLLLVMAGSYWAYTKLSSVKPQTESSAQSSKQSSIKQQAPSPGSAPLLPAPVAGVSIPQQVQVVQPNRSNATSGVTASATNLVHASNSRPAYTRQVAPIRISTIPAGVEVLVDGVSHGTTQAPEGQAYSDYLTVSYVPVGFRTVEFKKSGYSPLKRAIVVQEGNDPAVFIVELMPLMLPPIGSRSYVSRTGISVEPNGTYQLSYADGTTRTYQINNDRSVLYVEGNQKGLLQSPTNRTERAYTLVMEDGRSERIQFSMLSGYASAQVTRLNGTSSAVSSLTGHGTGGTYIRVDRPQTPGKPRQGYEMLERLQPSPVVSGLQGLCLSPEWNKPCEDAFVAQDLQCLLGVDGNPVVDTRPHPEIMIYRDVHYLEPLELALQKLGTFQLPDPVEVKTSGFPKNSLFYYAVDGEFDGGFNKLLVVADAKKQVVAMEFSASCKATESNDRRRLSTPTFSSPNPRVVYDLINGRSKEGSNCIIGCQKTRRGRCLRIDFEYAGDPASVFSVTERVRLYLPQPIVDLVLYRCKPSLAAEALMNTPPSAVSEPPPPPAMQQPTPPAKERSSLEGLALSKEWQNTPEKGSLILDELRQLLDRRGEPAVDLSPHPEIVIYNDVHYLEPFNDVCKKFGKTEFSAPVQLGCPGFPEKSFYYYAFDGDYDDQFTRLLIVADLKKQVVAIEFTDDKGKGQDSKGRGEWKVQDFVRLRMKGITSWNVTHNVNRARSGSLIIDSSLHGKGRVLQRTRLFLPRPIVNLVLFRLSGQKYQPPATQ
ncbi:MAG: FHA domain-containing protein [bacterium]